MSSSGMTTKQLEPIAERIGRHLRRFEEDPEINAPVTRPNGMTVTPYYHAQACAWRKRVRIRYVTYQGDTDLTAGEALAYLEWLDAGNAGTHRQMLRGAVTSPAPRTDTTAP